MILSDREIQVARARGLIGITDVPTDPARWSPTTVDLALDDELRVWDEITGPGVETVIDPMSDDFDSNALVRKYAPAVSCSGGYVLEPKKLVLGWTIQKIKLPHTSRIAARVEGKSSLARIGLGIHVTAPIIHPGFGIDLKKPKYPGSAIRLEIWNVGPLRIKLTKGMPICQVLFEEVHGTPEEGYTGQFSVQGPVERGRQSRR